MQVFLIILVKNCEKDAGFQQFAAKLAIFVVSSDIGSLVYLAPTPAARNLIKSYYSSTLILLPPLSSLVLQSPPTMLSLNLK